MQRRRGDAELGALLRLLTSDNLQRTLDKLEAFGLLEMRKVDRRRCPSFRSAERFGAWQNGKRGGGAEMV